MKYKSYSFFALIVIYGVLLLFLLLGLALTIFFIQNLFIGYSGFGLMQILFFIVGIYLVYKPVMHFKFLIKNRNKFDKIFDDFIKENKIAIILTAVFSVVLLSIFYSNIYLNFDFFLNAVLFLPIFLLNNLVFIVNIFILRYNLTFMAPLMELILPISEILFLFVISQFIAKFIKHKKSNENEKHKH